MRALNGTFTVLSVKLCVLMGGGGHLLFNSERMVDEEAYNLHQMYHFIKVCHFINTLGFEDGYYL